MKKLVRNVVLWAKMFVVMVIMKKDLPVGSFGMTIRDTENTMSNIIFRVTLGLIGNDYEVRKRKDGVYELRTNTDFWLNSPVTIQTVIASTFGEIYYNEYLRDVTIDRDVFKHLFVGFLFGKPEMCQRLFDLLNSGYISGEIFRSVFDMEYRRPIGLQNKKLNMFGVDRKGYEMFMNPSRTGIDLFKDDHFVAATDNEWQGHFIVYDPSKATRGSKIS